MQILKHIFPLSIVAAIVEETIFCVHGGLSPDTYNPEMVRFIKIYIENSNITFLHYHNRFLY